MGARGERRRLRRGGARFVAFAAGALLLAAAVEACSTTYTSNASADGGANDASLDTTGGGGEVDGAAQPTDDGATSADAGVDVYYPPSFCAMLSPAPAFCSDFDEEPSPFPKWTGPNIVPEGGATVGFDTMAFVSKPASAVFNLSAGPTDAVHGRVVTIGQTLPVVPTATVHLAVRLRLDAIDPNITVHTLAVAFVSNKGYELELNFGTGYGFLEEDVPDGDGGRTYNEYALASVPAIGVWTLVELTIDLNAKTATVTYDGAMPDTHAITPGPIGPVSVSIGPGYYHAGVSVAATTIHYDDVRLDVH
jgi:hypothetical protein